MAQGIRKLKDEAQKAVEKGKWKKAAMLFDEVARAQPEDTGPLHRAGESYRKLGRPDEAVARFEREAALYARQGFLIKAIAICKLILEIDPSHTKTQETLAHLYAEQRESIPRGAGAPRPAEQSSSGPHPPLAAVVGSSGASQRVAQGGGALPALQSHRDGMA